MKINEPQENYLTGYVRLFRSVSKKGWYKKQDYFHLWGHLMIQATHRGMEYFWNGKTIKLKPGQFVTGRKKLSLETGIQQSKIERILKVFKSEQQIEQQTSATSRLISILNWDSYQNVEQGDEQRVNNGRTLNKNDNNDKKKKGKKPILDPVKQKYPDYRW